MTLSNISEIKATEVEEIEYFLEEDQKTEVSEIETKDNRIAELEAKLQELELKEKQKEKKLELIKRKNQEHYK
jgi:hypothetical protein